MTIANIYRKLKQILTDSNEALINRGLNTVHYLKDIPAEITKLGNINRLPYLVSREIIEVTEDDLAGVTTIGYKSFGSCRNLMVVKIPDSVTIIENYVFQYCYSLKDVYLYPTTPPTLKGMAGTLQEATIHVPIGSGESYRSTTNWSSLADNIVEDIVVE